MKPTAISDKTSPLAVQLKNLGDDNCELSSCYLFLRFGSFSQKAGSSSVTAKLLPGHLLPTACVRYNWHLSVEALWCWPRHVHLQASFCFKSFTIDCCLARQDTHTNRCNESLCFVFSRPVLWNFKCPRSTPATHECKVKPFGEKQVSAHSRHTKLRSSATILLAMLTSKEDATFNVEHASHTCSSHNVHTREQSVKDLPYFPIPHHRQR